jgi:hypothetical protein
LSRPKASPVRTSPSCGTSHSGKTREGEQRPDVVERQHARYQVLELEIPAQQPHQQRDLDPHQDADREHEHIEQRLEEHAGGERGEQQHRGEPADHAHRDLDLDEALERVAADEPRQPRPHAHREEVGPITVEKRVSVSPTRYDASAPATSS